MAELARQLSAKNAWLPGRWQRVRRNALPEVLAVLSWRPTTECTTVLQFHYFFEIFKAKESIICNHPCMNYHVIITRPLQVCVDCHVMVMWWSCGGHVVVM